MAFVIKRHLSKSGGNGIGMRIGRFNSFSSIKCQKLKEIAHHATKTSKFRRCKRERESIVTLFNTINTFRARETLSIYFEWSHRSHHIIRAPRWKAKQAYSRVWIRTYAKRITNKIFKNCYSYTDLREKHPLGIIDPSFPKVRFRSLVIKIIKKNANFRHAHLLQGNSCRNLIDPIITLCAHRWMAGPASFQGRWYPHAKLNDI
jgi:hypothetical protein